VQSTLAEYPGFPLARLLVAAVKVVRGAFDGGGHVHGRWPLPWKPQGHGFIAPTSITREGKTAGISDSHPVVLPAARALSPK
jgi:hypothetical protein